ncbi:MAG: transcriptional regulator [Myxococcota bacterium]|nr:transcriptional regulator [Myxococcota bacterium]
MADKQWDKNFVAFLKRSGEDLKRTGEEIRKEAQRLFEEVRDPETQAKLKDRFTEFGGWAKKTAEEAAGMIETVVKKAEDSVRAKAGTESATPRPAAARPAAAPAPKKAAPKKPATKTVGAKKSGGGSRKPGVGTNTAKKSIGPKKK